MQDKKEIRVRFAPSPTGNVHIGNIRAAIYNWLFARHEGGKFLLRIEDTDKKRSTPEAIQTLFNAMKWFELDYDEPPVYQSKNLKRHQEMAEYLLKKSKESVDLARCVEPSAAAGSSASPKNRTLFGSVTAGGVTVSAQRAGMLFCFASLKGYPWKMRCRLLCCVGVGTICQELWFGSLLRLTFWLCSSALTV